MNTAYIIGFWISIAIIDASFLTQNEKLNNLLLRLGVLLFVWTYICMEVVPYLR